MKKSKLLRIALVVLIAALLCCALVFVTSAEGTETTEPTSGYLVTNADGETLVAEGATWSMLLGYNPTAIKCYSDIVVDSNVKYSTTLNIDLNTHAIIQGGGRVRPDGSATITIRGGNIEHKDTNSNFAYCSSPTANLVIEDCNIDCTKAIFSDWRGGDITLTRVIITSSATTDAFVKINTAADNSTANFNSVTYKDAQQPLVSLHRDDNDISKSVVMDSVTISTSSSIVKISDDATAATAATVTVKGNSKLSFGDAFASGGTFDNITYNFAPGVKATKIPTVAKGSIVYVDNALPFAENTDTEAAEYPYATVRAPYIYALTFTDNQPVQYITDETVTFANVLEMENLKSIVCYTAPVVSEGTTGITIPAGVTFDLNGNKFTRDYQYVLTFADGTSQYVFNNPTFNNVVATANLESLVCYTDPVITASISLPSIVIDLNGNELSQGGKFYLHVPLGNTAEIRNGTLTHSQGNLVNMGAGKAATEAGTLIFDDCQIVSPSYNTFVIYNGNVVVKNSTITGTNTSIRFAWIHNGYTAGLTIENSDVNIKNTLAYIQRPDNNEEFNLTIKDSTVTTTGSLLDFMSGSPTKGTMAVNVLGESKLSFNKFIAAPENSSDRLVYAFEYGVMMSAVPNIEKGTTQYINKSGVPGSNGEFLDSGDTTLPYVVGAVQLPVNAQFALTLYTDFTLNLCFNEEDANKIASVKVGGAEITPVVNNGLHIYRIAGISAINAATAQEIELVINDADTTVNKTIKYSIVDYANALLASDYSAESKQLVCRALDYIKAVHDYTATEIPAVIAALLENANYIAGDENATEVPAGNISTDALKPFLKGATLKPDTGVKFRFFLQDDIGSGEITVSSRSEKVTYTVENSLIDGKNYFDVNMRAFDLYDGTVTLSYGDNTGTYDFKTYANSNDVINDTNEKIGDLMLAFYNYFREANEYLMVADKDFA